MTKRISQEYSDKKILATLAALANAPTWHETEAVFKKGHKVLTSDRSFELLCEIIYLHHTSNEVAEVENWNQYLHLLEKAVNAGPEKAWEEFITLQHEAQETIERLIGAGTRDIIHDVLLHEELLLSNEAFVALRSKIAYAQASNDIEFAEYMQHLLHLLEAVRKDGHAAAWENWKFPL